MKDRKDWLSYLMSDTEMTLLQKGIIIIIVQNSKIHYSSLMTSLKTTKSGVIMSIKSLQESGTLSISGEVFTWNYDNTSYSCQIAELNIGLIRIPRDHSMTEKARIKLDQLRLVGFIGVDALIAKLSKDYDQTVVKYVGISEFSIPPNFQKAIKSKNWIHFKRLHQLLVDRQIPTLPYLECQFKTMIGNGKGGRVYPYPSMLYSSWALTNYANAVKDNIARNVTDNMFLDETEVIKEVMLSSYAIVKQLTDYHPELSELQAILLSADSVSPLYLSLHNDYLKHCVKYEQELPEDLARVLLRYEKAPEFKKLVKTIYQEVRKA